MASQDGTPAVTRERTSFAVVHARLPEQFGWQPAKLRRRSCGTTILEGAWELAQDNSVTPARPAKPGTAATLSIGIGGMVGGGMFAITGLAVGIARGAGTDRVPDRKRGGRALQFAEVAEASDFALSRAAREFSGNTGYFAIAVAALLATTSAINATFCGSGKFACFVSKSGQLPTRFKASYRGQHAPGTFITAVLALVAVNRVFPEAMATMGSGRVSAHYFRRQPCQCAFGTRNRG